MMSVSPSVCLTVPIKSSSATDRRCKKEPEMSSRQNIFFSRHKIFFLPPLPTKKHTRVSPACEGSSKTLHGALSLCHKNTTESAVWPATRAAQPPSACFEKQIWNESGSSLERSLLISPVNHNSSFFNSFFIRVGIHISLGAKLDHSRHKRGCAVSIPESLDRSSSPRTNSSSSNNGHIIVKQS